MKQKGLALANPFYVLNNCLSFLRGLKKEMGFISNFLNAVLFQSKNGRMLYKIHCQLSVKPPLTLK